MRQYTASELAKEVDEILAECKDSALTDNPEELMESLLALPNAIARAGIIHAQAKTLHLMKSGEAYEAYLAAADINPKLYTSTAVKAIVEGRVRSYADLEFHAEKAWKALDKKLRAIISALSYLRTDLNNAKYQRP